MKFTDKLRFNSVPEWREYYINYASGCLPPSCCVVEPTTAIGARQMVYWLPAA